MGTDYPAWTRCDRLALAWKIQPARKVAKKKAIEQNRQENE
jgi:hypothetical protein